MTLRGPGLPGRSLAEPVLAFGLGPRRCGKRINLLAKESVVRGRVRSIVFLASAPKAPNAVETGFLQQLAVYGLGISKSSVLAPRPDPGNFNWEPELDIKIQCFPLHYFWWLQLLQVSQNLTKCRSPKLDATNKHLRNRMAGTLDM